MFSNISQEPYITLSKISTISTILLILSQVLFIINILVSLKKRGERVPDNPWGANTLEWQTSSPPPHGNFLHPVKVYHWPYNYGLPGIEKDYLPQNEEIDQSILENVKEELYEDA